MKKLLAIKAIFLIVVLLVVWLCQSCSDYHPSYYKEEVDVFLSTGQAVQTKDSVNVFNSKYINIKFPIVKIGNIGYYPKYRCERIMYDPAVMNGKVVMLSK